MTLTIARPLSPVLLALTLSLAAGPLSSPDLAAAGVYRCTNAAGEVYFSDESCPAGFAKEELQIPSRAPPAAAGRQAGGSGEDPYSPIAQVKRLEQEQASRRRAAAASRQGGASPEGQARLGEIDERLKALARQAGYLRDDLSGNRSSIRKRWAREELTQMQRQEADLLQERRTITGRPAPRTAVIADVPTAQAQARAEKQAKAERARQAKQAQREAEQRAQEAAALDQAAAQRARTGQWQPDEAQGKSQVGERRW